MLRQVDVAQAHLRRGLLIFVSLVCFGEHAGSLRAKHRNLSAKNGAAGQIRIQPPNMVISYDFIMKQGEFSGVYTKIQN